MSDLILYTVFVALLAAFIILLLTKVGAIEWIQINVKSDLINEGSRCQFCLAFWIGLLIAILFALFTGDLIWLATPFCSTPLTRAIL